MEWRLADNRICFLTSTFNEALDNRQPSTFQADAAYCKPP
jgi:hypothetical protein